MSIEERTSMDESLNKEDEPVSLLARIAGDRGLLTRICITIGFIVAYRLLLCIPIPGIDMHGLKEFFSSLTRTSCQTTESLYSLSLMRRFSILAVGIMPYLSSCILIQILGTFVPFLKKYYGAGTDKGRQGIVKSTYFLTFVLCVIQAFFISLWLENPGRFQGLRMVLWPGWSFRILTVLSMTAGTFLLLWLADRMTKYGIGNGVAILIFSDIVLEIPEALSQIASPVIMSHVRLISLCICIGTGAVIWKLTRAAQKIPIVQENSAATHFLPLRFTFSGRESIDFAQAIILLPAVMISFFPGGFRGGYLPKEGVVYWAVLSLLLFFFTFLYAAIVYNPLQIVRLLKKYNFHIEDKDSEAGMVKYLQAVITRNALIATTLLAAVTVLPALYSIYLRLSYLVTAFVGGAYLLVLIGVFSDLQSQVEAYFTRKDARADDHWQVVHIALDEIEAEIKRGVLVSKGIACVIEPLRFTWGMPIRTAVDQYRLYVQGNQKEEAIKLLAAPEFA